MDVGTWELPDSAVLAWWATAWLRGHTVTDLVLEAVMGGDRVSDERHVVVGLHDGPRGAPLLDLLAHLRRAGATGVGLALPRPGDPLGIGSGPELVQAAMQTGEAAVCADAGVAVVPTRIDDEVFWQLYPAGPRQLPDLGEADRGLRLVLLQTAQALADLDVARWRPEVADALLDLRQRDAPIAPPGTPPSCAGLVDRALQCAAVVGLAGQDVGGALNASEVGRRDEAIRALEAAARRALVAACSPESWPPDL